MQHEMNLKDAPFERIKSGAKKIEIRLNDKKRQKIKIGDIILFTNVSDFSKKIKVEVLGLILYPTFAEMVDDIPVELMGYQEPDREYLRSSIYEIYTLKEEAKYGILGIRFRLLN